MSVSARRFWVFLAALGFASLTTSLGFWQLRRAEYKTELAQLIQRRQLDRPLHNSDWPCTQKPDALPDQRPVVLTGHWLSDRLVYLDNRSMDGQAGFDVVTPLRLDPTPVCGPALVLVQRGWVPRDALDRKRLLSVQTPAGLVEVNGRLVLDVSQAYALGHEPDVQPGSR
ncbi:MAG TPA: SURF1 family protein, partial [Aquabacterium sp.]|nr:SURF1 family protein [Aquabacterium sp.]